MHFALDRYLERGSSPSTCLSNGRRSVPFRETVLKKTKETESAQLRGPPRRFRKREREEQPHVCPAFRRFPEKCRRCDLTVERGGWRGSSKARNKSFIPSLSIYRFRHRETRRPTRRVGNASIHYASGIFEQRYQQYIYIYMYMYINKIQYSVNTFLRTLLRTTKRTRPCSLLDARICYRNSA